MSRVLSADYLSLEWSIDLATRRQREQRSPDAVGVQHRVEIDWTRAGRSRTDG